MIRIETPRLILRPLELDDFDAWAEFDADDEATRFLGGVKPRAVSWRSFMFFAGSWALQGFGPFSIIEKSSGCWIGRVGPLFPEGWPGTEIGWSLAPQAWGKGYAFEAAVAAIDWAFAQLDWTEIIHCIDDDNVASQALAHKLGSSKQRRERMPPPYEDHVVDIWGQSRDAWLSSSKVRSA